MPGSLAHRDVHGPPTEQRPGSKPSQDQAGPPTKGSLRHEATEGHAHRMRHRVQAAGEAAMSAARYASNTAVSSERSRAEIERILGRYGATEFGYATNNDRAMVIFTMEGRRVRFMLPLPNRHDREFTHTPTRGNARTHSQAEAAYEQAIRQSWRALALVVQAKLEAVVAGIVTFEQEFGMHMLLPDGSTVAEHVSPWVEASYRLGEVPSLLAIGSGS